MNITFLSNPFGYGAAKMLLFIAKGLQNKGHNVTIIVLGQRGNFDYLAEDLHVVYKQKTDSNTYLKLLKDIYYVCKHTKSLKTDILISFLGTPNFITTIVSKILNIPSVISERVDPFVEYKESSPLSRIQKKITNFATGAVFQTEGASKFYCKRLQKKGAIIPNPVHIKDNILPLDYNNLPKEIIYLGRLNNKQKRLDIALESFAIFHNSHPEYILKIFGGGKDEEYVKQLIQKLRIKDFVYLMGISKDPINDLSNGGIFLITSDYEGISNSLLEAMAIGLPVVSTDHSPGGGRLLIDDHKNGILVPIGDSKAVAMALSEFAENSSLAEKCGKNAIKVKSRFSKEVIIDAWNQYLKTVSTY